MDRFERLARQGEQMPVGQSTRISANNPRRPTGRVSLASQSAVETTPEHTIPSGAEAGLRRQQCDGDGTDPCRLADEL